MIENRKINVICAAAMAAVILLTGIMLAFSQNDMAAETVYSEPLYAKKVFGTEVISVDIVADEKSWQEMLDNALSEEYISADVIINGKRFSNVGIRPKGNNSLQQTASSDSDRYSFKISFDKYVEGQTCFGLDMLVLNNMIGDATYMKEYIAFDMMREMGIETPYYSYADITVNGEKWGFYFALEAYNDSYERRVSGDESGVLYSVKSSMGQGGMGGFADKERPDLSAMEFPGNNPPAENTGRQEFIRPERGMGGMGASSSGGSLVYTDDNSSSYPAIFENAVGNNSSEDDYQRVTAALKALSIGENPEEYFDIDEILRYLAVHTVTVNLDSYSSGMAQNYFIYEYGGVIKILPWDYNYAWGAFQTRSASEAVNFPIDTPVSGVEMSERPLISKLFENEEYLERYHSYLRKLMDSYFSGGSFSAKIDEINSRISEYVRTDPTSFYSYEEYTAATAEFKVLGELRMESIYGQLDGTVPSTSEGQSSSPEKLIDSSSVTLSKLGTSGNGGERSGNFPAQNGDFPQPPAKLQEGDFPHNMPEGPRGDFHGGEMKNGTPTMDNKAFGNEMPVENNSEKAIAIVSIAVLAAGILCAVLVKRKF